MLFLLCSVLGFFSNERNTNVYLKSGFLPGEKGSVEPLVESRVCSDVTLFINLCLKLEKLIISPRQNSF